MSMPAEIPVFLETEDVADATHSEPQTIRKHHSKKGHFLGVVPIKVGRRLLWPKDQIAAALSRRAA